jgi:hypothetical protein
MRRRIPKRTTGLRRGFIRISRAGESIKYRNPLQDLGPEAHNIWPLQASRFPPDSETGQASLCCRTGVAKHILSGTCGDTTLLVLLKTLIGFFKPEALILRIVERIETGNKILGYK